MPPEPTFVIGHRRPDTDSVCSAIAYAHLKAALGDHDVRPAAAGPLNAETRYALARFGVAEPERLTTGAGRRLILVDHNEVAQAVDGVADAAVVEVWEHHRVGDLDLAQPIVFHCEPVGATATLITEQFVLHGVEIPPAIAGLLLAAILSDTLGFASPTAVEKDRTMAARLAAIAGVDAAAFGRELMAARGDVAARPADDLVAADFKEFDLAGHRVGIGQIEAADTTPLLPRRAELVGALERRRAARALEFALLLVTDIARKGSHLWVTGPGDAVVAQAFGLALEDRGVYLAGCMSRKKQVVPPLERALAAHRPAAGPATPAASSSRPDGRP